MKGRFLLALALLLAGCDQTMDVGLPASESSDAVAEALRLGDASSSLSTADVPVAFLTDTDGGQLPILGSAGELATLGRVLFYERQLSRDGSISCASCHRQSDGFSDRSRFSRGIGGALTSRQSMSVANVSLYPNGRMFWDERAGSLEEQALIPIQDPREMGLTLDEAVARVEAQPYYESLFIDAFGDDHVSPDRIADALSAFQQTIVTRNSRWDAWLAAGGGQGGAPGGIPAGDDLAVGDDADADELGGVVVGGPPPPPGDGRRGGPRGGNNGGGVGPGNNGGGAGGGGVGGNNGGNGGGGVQPGAGGRGVFTALEEQGRRLFFSRRTQCGACHSGPDLVGGRPFNNGLDINTAADQGAGRGRFKTASLRNIALTAPYMHDGRFQTLREVIEHYDSGVQPHPALDNRLRTGNGQPRRLNLTETEKAALEAFLRTLTDETLATDERFSNPFIR